MSGEFWDSGDTRRCLVELRFLGCGGGRIARADRLGEVLCCILIFERS